MTIRVAGSWFTVFERDGKHFMVCDTGELFGKISEYALTPEEALQASEGDTEAVKVLMIAQQRQAGRYVHAIPTGAVGPASLASMDQSPSVSHWPRFLRVLRHRWKQSWWVCVWRSDDPSGIIHNQGGKFAVFADTRKEANTKVEAELPDLIFTSGKRTLLIKWKVRRPYVWELVRSLF